MNSWWLLANLVLAAHILLFVFLALGVVLAAAGWTRRHARAAVGFWLALTVTLALQPVPGCGLTQLERWLRWKQDPDWHRELSLLRTVVETVTGVHAPAILDTLFPAALAVLGVYAFTRYHLHDLLTVLRRPTKAPGP